MYTVFGLFCISVLALAATHATAADQTCPDAAFHVRGVGVSASAGSGSEARAIATRQGLERAWRLLTERLLVDGESMDELAAAEGGLVLDDMVDHIRVLDERVLQQRYIAAFDYCFDRNKARRYFAGLGARHAELVSAPMLVLPVWNSGSQPRIWRQPNLWADAWEEILGSRNGLVTLRLPASLAIERAISAEAAFERDAGTLARAARIEATEKVIVTVVTPEVKGDSMTVSVSASLYNRDGSIESEFYTLDSLSFPVDTTSETMLWLAGQIGDGIEKVWRSVNAVTLLETTNVVALRISADTITEWRDQIDQLRSLPPVERVDVLQLSSGGGTVRVELSSTMQSFVYALEAEGLAIDQGTGNDGSPTMTLVPRNS